VPAALAADLRSCITPYLAKYGVGLALRVPPWCTRARPDVAPTELGMPLFVALLSTSHAVLFTSGRLSARSGRELLAAAKVSD